MPPSTVFFLPKRLERTPSGKNAAIAESVATLGLKYAVVTCVTRDDLPDGGAEAMRNTILAIREKCPETLVEVLVSDYNADHQAMNAVMTARPAVYGHNLETVERLTPAVRSRAQYRRSLECLEYVAKHCAPQTVVKSGVMLGLGETDDEIRQCLQDLRKVGVAIVTLGQYLQPTHEQLPVERFVTPAEFAEWQRYADDGRKADAHPHVDDTVRSHQHRRTNSNARAELVVGTKRRAKGESNINYE